MLQIQMPQMQTTLRNHSTKKNSFPEDTLTSYSLNPNNLLLALSLAPLPGAELGPISILPISALSTAISSSGIFAGTGGARCRAPTWYALLLAAALAYSEARGGAASPGLGMGPKGSAADDAADGSAARLCGRAPAFALRSLLRPTEAPAPAGLESAGAESAAGLALAGSRCRGPVYGLGVCGVLAWAGRLAG